MMSLDIALNPAPNGLQALAGKQLLATLRAIEGTHEELERVDNTFGSRNGPVVELLAWTRQRLRSNADMVRTEIERRLAQHESTATPEDGEQ